MNPPFGITDQPSIGIIIIHLNAYEHTARCLESLRNVTYKNIKIFIIDNGSSDDSGRLLVKEFPEIIYIRSETNEGATGGKNIGIEHAFERHCQYVLFLDNDTIVTPSFIEPMVERLDSDPSIAAVSGKIYFYPPTVGGRKNILWYAGAYQKWHLGYNHYGDGEEDKGQYENASSTAFTCSCLMLVRSNILERIGGFDNEYFIYWEEPDWCLRALKQGYSSWYEPRSFIYHNLRSELLGRETPLYAYLQYRNFMIFAHHYFHGLQKIQFLLFSPLIVLNRCRICMLKGNIKAAKYILFGIFDYFKGYTGKQGLIERSILKP